MVEVVVQLQLLAEMLWIHQLEYPSVHLVHLDCLVRVKSVAGASVVARPAAIVAAIVVEEE